MLVGEEARTVLLSIYGVRLEGLRGSEILGEQMGRVVEGY